MTAHAIADDHVGADLFVTQTGSRLHVPGCPHVGSALAPASAADLLALTVCSWCRAELDGTGRTYYATLGDALRAHGMPVGTERRVREVLRFVTHDQVWRPYKGLRLRQGDRSVRRAARLPRRSRRRLGGDPGRR